MSIADLKTDIIHRIAGITDKTRLEEIYQLISFQSENDIFITSDEDKQAIQEARNQIADGQFFSHEDVQNEIQEWLKK